MFLKDLNAMSKNSVILYYFEGHAGYNVNGAPMPVTLVYNLNQIVNNKLVGKTGFKFARVLLRK
jgi:hypothetical protein